MLRSKSAAKSKDPEEISYGNVVLLGMPNVGKTAIVDRFVNNYHTPKYTATTSQLTYEVNALIQCEKENGNETKKTMVFKKSFKKSILGKSRPLKPKMTMKRVLTHKGSSDGTDNSSAYVKGKEKGLKTLKFNLIDTPDEIVEMEPISYEATIANAKGFLLVCSFDVPGSLEYVKKRFDDIKGMRNVDETPIILIANKYDIKDKIWEEHESNTLAAQLKVKYCKTSVITKEGCEQMIEVMLNEINMFAEEEKFQDSLPEDYAYYDNADEKEICDV